MESMYQLDLLLLDLTKKAAGKVQRTFGTNNFDLARILCDVCIVLSFVHIFLVLLGIGDASWIEKFLAVSYLLICLFVLPMIVESNRARYKPGFANPERISQEMTNLRVIFMFIASVCMVGIAVGIVDFLLAGEADWVNWIEGMKYILMFPMAYLASVEPDPPSESRFKKLFGKLRAAVRRNPERCPA